MVLCDDGKIEVKDLPDAVQTVQRKEASVSAEVDNVGARKRVYTHTSTRPSQISSCPTYIELTFLGRSAAGAFNGDSSLRSE